MEQIDPAVSKLLGDANTQVCRVSLYFASVAFSSYCLCRLASGEGIVVLASVCVCVRPAAIARRSAALVSAAKVMRCIQCCLVLAM